LRNVLRREQFNNRAFQKFLGPHFDHFQKRGVRENDPLPLVIDDDTLIERLKKHPSLDQAIAAESSPSNLPTNAVYFEEWNLKTPPNWRGLP
jgi:hypothetical protein